MPDLLLIRHGETDWNNQGRLQGTTDVPLNEEGRSQARALAEHLADWPLAGVWSSPLSRALETAEAVAQVHGLAVSCNRDLREIEMGQWEGLTIPEVKERWGGHFDQWSSDPVNSLPPPDGEDFVGFQNRGMAALAEIAAQYGEDKQVAVICHGGFIRAVMMRILENSPGNEDIDLWFDNCSITRLRWQADNDVMIGQYNDNGHLKTFRGGCTMLVDLNVKEFCARIADGNPTPGGGTAAAVSGAMGASLVSMFCNVTAGRKKYAAVKDDMEETARHAVQWQQKLLELADLDSQAFQKVLEANRMPKETDEEKQARKEASDAASLEATRVPLQTAAACVAVIEVIPALAARGNPNALSDLKVGLELLWTGFQGALANVEINLPWMPEGEAGEIEDEVLHLTMQAQKAAEQGREQIGANI